MRRLRFALFVLVLAIGGASVSVSAQEKPPAPKPAFDPAGHYDLQLTFGGQPMNVALDLVRSNDKWTGSAGNDDVGMATVTGLTQEGRTMRISLGAEDVTLSLTLTVKEDNTVEGEWEGNGDGSAVKGKKTK